MKPLVITATPNICWLKPDVEYPKTIDELIQEAKRCESAGAAVLHIHAEERWAETIRELKEIDEYDYSMWNVQFENS